MTQVNKEGSRIIENDEGHVLVDTTDSLLVNEMAVVNGADVDEGVIAVEFVGRVNRTQEAAYVLMSIRADEVPTMISLLVESMVQQRPEYIRELRTMVFDIQDRLRTV